MYIYYVLEPHTITKQNKKMDALLNMQLYFMCVVRNLQCRKV